jgi:hypothetical protein
MNDSSTTSQITELILRRLVDPINVMGKELPPQVWVVVLVFVLLAGFFYIGWMYFKDSRGVGAGWATLLGLLRACVYLVLAWVFLLPGRQTVESSTSHSKVLVIFDSSGSQVLTVDDPPADGVSLNKMKTRQDKVLALLADSKVNLLGRLLEKNPVTAYRFAKEADQDFWYIDKGVYWTAAERRDYEEKRRDPAHANEPEPEPKPLADLFWKTWLKPVDPAAVPGEPALKPVTAPEDWSDEDKARFKTLQDGNLKLRDRNFFNATNISDSVQSILSKEQGNMLQGIVVFTDGRSTEGSDLVFEDLDRRARAANVPIFVVGVGEDRLQVKIEIADTRGPAQVQPEDKFRIMVDLVGEGKDDQEVDATLEIVNIKKNKEGNKDEFLDITVIEAEDKGNPNKKRQEINLGKSVFLKPEKAAKFDHSSPPRVQLEYVVDAYALANAIGTDLTKGEYAGRKWEIGETKDSELRARQHVPKDRLEVFAGKEHIGDPLDLRVIKRPVRVLLMASGPTHDFQFLTALMIREVEKKRAELSVYMQLPPGRTPAERRTGQVYGTDRILEHFPDRLDQPNDDPAQKLYDMDQYDVLVGFDPDWNQLSETELKVLQRWVDKGGGLIVIGGPINTVQLAKPGAAKDKVKPILELYPIILKDVRIDELDRTTELPWTLTFEGATPEMEFLKLDENPSRPFLADWEEFFYGRNLTKGEQPPPVQNGFFNYYPAEAVKVGSQVVARFADPRAKLKDGSQMPWIVLSDPNSGRRVSWIANGETYRLRKFNEAYHERFWTKLLRYSAAKNQSKIKYKQNQFIQVDARIDGPGGEPLRKDAKVRLNLTLPTGVPEKEIPTKIDMKPKPGNDPLDAGKFSAKIQVRSPGEYALELKVEDTGDTESRKFSVVEANPEMDNTRPDFDRMYRMASEADAVIARMGPTEGAELKKRLQRPRLTPPGPKEQKLDDKPRLYFDLKNAELIPNCMVTESKTRTTRGQIVDTWDQEAKVYLPSLGWFTIMPFAYGWMYIAVILFSTEWLIRKLLRLA